MDTAGENKDKLISNVRLCIGWLAKICIYNLCVDTGCSLKDLLKAVNHGDGWLYSKREKERERKFRDSELSSRADDYVYIIEYDKGLSSWCNG